MNREEMIDRYSELYDRMSGINAVFAGRNFREEKVK